MKAGFGIWACNSAMVLGVVFFSIAVIQLVTHDISKRYSKAKILEKVEGSEGSVPGHTYLVSYKNPTKQQVYQNHFNPIAVNGKQVGDEILIRYDVKTPETFQRGLPLSPVRNSRNIFFIGVLIFGASICLRWWLASQN